MTTAIRRALLFALYQVSILAGILLVPALVAARRLGLRVPAANVVAPLNEAYESTRSTA